ncbi:hypothetical protein [Sanguibacter suaedae]|uniref:Sensor domain-containing protein n=1 Tax=Sanguibacter suaedae TaxID=2795737 RepID=A0A934MAE1_9MICO|nr:hypothetical protein [Sanguibacter suaedae]MBI9115663.1 hypothetical protein [Sanguibacter suaedae]
MRRSTALILCTVTALTLSGCGATDDDAAANPTTDTTTATSGTTGPAGETGDAEPADPDFAAPTDIPADVMLPVVALEPSVGPREETEGVVEWRMSATCEPGTPEAAAAMRTVVQGDGEFEAPVAVQQVAVFDDAQAATDESDRLRFVLAECAQFVSDDRTAYAVEDVEVGAQGVGMSTDYYGAGGDDALGTYLAVTRRGNAVTLVSVEGGEGTVGDARRMVTADAQEAWNQLCRYDSEGC